MLEPTRPHVHTLSSALIRAATLDSEVATTLAAEVRWREWSTDKWDAEMDDLRQSNAAMVRQLRDQDLRTERQHREWDEKMRTLQDEFDNLSGRRSASDGTVTALKDKLARVGAAIKSLNELLSK